MFFSFSLEFTIMKNVWTTFLPKLIEFAWYLWLQLRFHAEQGIWEKEVCLEKNFSSSFLKLVWSVGKSCLGRGKKGFLRN